MQQRNTQALLQTRHQPADTGRCQPQHAGSPRKTAYFHDAHKDRHLSPLVPAWYASPQPVWHDQSLFPHGIPELTNTTVRQFVRLGFGGHAPRLVLSNAYGTKPVYLKGVHLARSLDGATIDPIQGGFVRFAGVSDTVLAPGATLISDAIDMTVQTGETLAVSIHFTDTPAVESLHWEGRSTAQIIPGNQLDAARPEASHTTTVRLFVSGVLVEAASSGSVVVLGDSITNGAGATLDADTRWPDMLANRIAPAGLAVVNAGISCASAVTRRHGRQRAGTS